MGRKPKNLVKRECRLECRLDSYDIERINRLQKETGLSKTDIVSIAIQEYYDRNEERKEKEKWRTN